MDSIIRKIAQDAREYHSGAESGHGWWHVDRVRRIAIMIQKVKGEEEGQGVVKKILDNSGMPEDMVSEVLYIHENISFRKSLDGAVARTPELDIVQDADRLDAIGAIGIARAFSYGGSIGSEICIPGEKPVNIDSGDSYKNSRSSVINHFYEKLLTLKDKMNTRTGTEMAIDRHRFMELFLRKFFTEWNLDY